MDNAICTESAGKQTTQIRNILQILLDCYELSSKFTEFISRTLRAASRQPKYTDHIDQITLYGLIPIDWMTSTDYSWRDIGKFLTILLILDSGGRAMDLTKVFRHKVIIPETNDSLSFHVWETKNGFQKGTYSLEPCNIPAMDNYPHLNIVKLYLKYLEVTRDLKVTTSIQHTSGLKEEVIPVFFAVGTQNKTTKQRPVKAASSNQLSKIATDALREAKLQGTSHVIRGAVATEMLANGCPLVQVLHHLNVSMDVFIKHYYRPDFSDRSMHPQIHSTLIQWPTYGEDCISSSKLRNQFASRPDKNKTVQGIHQRVKLLLRI